jgi:hypothetical protein
VLRLVATVATVVGGALWAPGLKSAIGRFRALQTIRPSAIQHADD